MDRRVKMIFESPKIGMSFRASVAGMIFRLDVMAPEIEEMGYEENSPYGDDSDAYGFVGLERK